MFCNGLFFGPGPLRGQIGGRGPEPTKAGCLQGEGQTLSPW